VSATGVIAFLGGIGLFLLGMKLMTEGLKVAAGDTLRTLLAAATRSRLRGLLSGVLITAMVQSSTAVIFATIGFVNAGLLSLGQAVGIIFGSNLGTTLTSWIVALLGFNVDLQALAMPAIAIGMALWVVFGTRQQGALGQALVGFGIFFLGIDVLKDSFAGIGDAIALDSWAGKGVFSLLLFIAIGVVMTLLMQSSSAALAVTLTAAAGGLIPLSAAAAMVIGANVGTTSTAAFAVLGATAPAKRAASAHVVFNLITAVVATTMLPLLLWLVVGIAGILGFPGQMATQLAIFHTLTKLLGIAILWPFTHWLVAFLETRFRSVEEDQSRPRYLDTNVLSAPSLAVDALLLELQRMSDLARDLGRAAISAEHPNQEQMEAGRRILDKLNLDISEFISGIAHHTGESRVTDLLPDALRVGHYLAEISESAVEMARLQPRAILAEGELVERRNQLWMEAVQLLSATAPSADGWSEDGLRRDREQFEQAYQGLKVQLLRAGTKGTLSPRAMAVLLEHLSALHRMVDQAVKSSIYLSRIIAQHQGRDPVAEDPPPDPAVVGAAADAEHARG